MNSNWEIARKIQQDLKRVEAQVGQDVVKLYRQAYAEMERDIGRFLVRFTREDGTITALDLEWARRTIDLQGQLRKVLEDFGEQVDNLTSRQVQSVALKHLESYAGSMEAILPPGMAISFDKLWPDVITSILNRKVQGLHFSERLGVIAPEVAGAMMDQLAIGAARGESIPQMRNRLMRTADISRYRAELISRTEVIRASNEAASWTYAQYEGVIKKKRRMATLDDRTCVACLAQDGEEYPLEAMMDDHPMGRCVFAAVTPTWQELGYDLPEPPVVRRARDPYSGENILVKFQDARSWFSSQSQDVQIRMMGRTRWRLWKDGLVDWKHLYGSGSAITPVQDLKNISGEF